MEPPASARAAAAPTAGSAAAAATDGLAVRRAHEAAQALAREIRGEEANSKESLDKLWALAGHVARLRSQVARLQEGQKGIWSQRWTWLHEEFVALAGERLQDPSAPPPDPTSAFWVRVAELLYAGSLRASEAVADANRAREAVAQRDVAVSEVRAELDSARRAVAERDERLQEAHGRVAGLQRAEAERAAAAAASEQGSNKEVLEMRTRLVVLQQEMARRVADHTALQEQHAAAVAERDALRERVAAAADSGATVQAKAEEQAAVIEDLMESSETAKRERVEFADKCAKLEEHNLALSQNLLQHASVIERLIDLNDELANAHNDVVQSQARAGGGGGDARIGITIDGGGGGDDNGDDDGAGVHAEAAKRRAAAAAAVATDARKAAEPNLALAFEQFMRGEAMAAV